MANDEQQSVPEGYLSVAEASREHGVPKHAIQRAVKRGEVRSIAHKWGIRVASEDVARLRVELDKRNAARGQ